MWQTLGTRRGLATADDTVKGKKISLLTKRLIDLSLDPDLGMTVERVVSWNFGRARIGKEQSGIFARREARSRAAANPGWLVAAGVKLPREGPAR